MCSSDLGFEGLVHNRTIPLPLSRIRGLLPKGGTILGTTNRGNPFNFPVLLPDGTKEARDYSQRVIQNMERMELDAVVAVGGDGTLGIAHKFCAMGARFIGIPKTIDNDISATEFTFGFMTAVDVATDAVDRLHTTAESHHRVMLLEVMGRDCGWIALYSGVAGGADVILIPEIPFDPDAVVGKIKNREEAGNLFSVIVVAEGAFPAEGNQSYVSVDPVTGQKRLGGISQFLAEQIQKKSNLEVRTTILGHIQRGGSPSAFDRTLATRFAVRAVDLLAEEKWDHMVAYRGGSIVFVPLEEGIGKLKRVEIGRAHV